MSQPGGVLPIYQNLPDVVPKLTAKDHLPTQEQQLKEQKLRSLIGKTITIYLTDGRIYSGNLICLDNKGAILSSQSYYVNSPTQTKEYVGMILVEKNDYLKITVKE